MRIFNKYVEIAQNYCVILWKTSIVFVCFLWYDTNIITLKEEEYEQEKVGNLGKQHNDGDIAVRMQPFRGEFTDRDAD